MSDGVFTISFIRINCLLEDVIAKQGNVYQPEMKIGWEMFSVRDLPFL